MAFRLHQITQALNIQPEEKFHIRSRTEIFYFTSEGLMKSKAGAPNEFEKADDTIFTKLLKGELEIVESRFTPTIGMIFYSYNRDWTVSGYKLNDYDLNYMCLYSLGMIFRTKEEALLKRDFYFKMLTGLTIEKFKKDGKRYPKDWCPKPKFNFNKLFANQEETPKPKIEEEKNIVPQPEAKAAEPIQNQKEPNNPAQEIPNTTNTTNSTNTTEEKQQDTPAEAKTKTEEENVTSDSPNKNLGDLITQAMAVSEDTFNSQFEEDITPSPEELIDADENIEQEEN